MSQPWLQHTTLRECPRSCPSRQLPLHRLLNKSAARFPNRAALVYYDGEGERELSRMTYEALDVASDRFAAALTGLGVSKGDRVAYFMQNCPELVVGFYGILKAGAVIVPCNPMYRGQELAYQLQDSGARAILCDADLVPRGAGRAPRDGAGAGHRDRLCARGFDAFSGYPVHGGVD